MSPRLRRAPMRRRLGNPVDQFIDAYFAERAVAWPEVVDDRTFLRRVYADTIGLSPTPEQQQTFLDDIRPPKRRILTEELLANNQAYAEHWMTFWNDALRNDFEGTGYIDGGRKQITDWLFRALHDNLPYDQFARQLLHPTPASEGFINGIIWRGVVAAAQMRPVQASQNVSQVFLGVNLKCASCHDSFIDDWNSPTPTASPIVTAMSRWSWCAAKRRRGTWRPTNSCGRSWAKSTDLFPNKGACGRWPTS